MTGRNRILIVDDEPEICQAVRRILKIAGIGADTAHNPIEALEMFTDQSYDVVVTDIRMPEMSGVEFLCELKNRFPFTQVIIMTGYSNMDILVECFGVGATDFFAKPLKNHEGFIQIIEQCLEKSTRWREGISFASTSTGGQNG